jgi:serine/threonine protein kinase
MLPDKENTPQLIESEIEIMKTFKHPNIVDFKGAYQVKFAH